MADHRYVDVILAWLEADWDSTNYPGSGGDGGGLNGQIPAFVDGDDADVRDVQGRDVVYDLSANNAVVVDSSPNRQQSPTGLEDDLLFEDGVEVRVVGVHETEWGNLADSAEFRRLYREVRRVLWAHRVWPDRNADGDTHAYRLKILDESNLSNRYADFYEYSFTATLDGHEDLPDT